MIKLASVEKFISMGLEVLALGPRSKKPHWKYAPHGYQSATRDIETIKDWLKNSPEINLGISIPNDLIILDIDNEAVFKEFGFEIPDTFTIRTHRGFHYYFKDSIRFSKQTGVENCMDFLKKIYAIIPPSIHPSGHQYFIEKDLPISEAPEWMIEYDSYYKRFGKSKEIFHKAAQVKSTSKTDQIPIGKRNVTLFWFGMNLRAQGGSAEVIKSSVKRESLRCEGNFSEKELLGIINSVNRYKRDEAMSMVSRGGDSLLHRERPFTYCMMKTLDLLEKSYEGQDLVKIKAIWLTICEIFDRTGNVKSITTFNQSISYFSGLSKNQVSALLSELKKLDLIEITNPQRKMENGQYRFTGKTIRLKEGF